LKTSRPSSWTGWRGPAGSLTTMESIILNEPIGSGISLIAVEKDWCSHDFLATLDFIRWGRSKAPSQLLSK
jgi:hypothetical protein